MLVNCCCLDSYRVECNKMFLLSRLPLTSTSNFKSAHYKYTYCCNTCIFWPRLSRYVNEYPTMHYFGNPRHTQSWWHIWFWLSISGNSSEKSQWECCKHALFTCDWTLASKRYFYRYLETKWFHIFCTVLFQQAVLRLAVVICLVLQYCRHSLNHFWFQSRVQRLSFHEFQ